MIVWSRFPHKLSDFAPPRTPALRSPAFHCASNPRSTSSIGSRIPQGNFLARLVFPKQTRRFSLEVDLTAEMTVINPFDFFLEPYAEKIPFQYEAWEQRELEPFLKAAPAGPKLQALLDEHRREANRGSGISR